MKFSKQIFVSILIIIPSLIFSFSPTLTLAAAADHIQSGPECQGSINENQVCYLDKNRGQTLVHIKWDLSSSFAGGDGHCGIYRFDSFRVGSFPSPDGWTSVWNWKNNLDLIGWSTNGTPITEFKAKDDVWILPASDNRISTIYKVICGGFVAISSGTKGTPTDTYVSVSSPTREIKPAACEMQFRDSVGALAGFGGAPVAITEESFKGWSQVNAEDNVGYTMETLTPETRADNLPLGNGGSGDQLDLASLMNDMYYARGPLMTYTRFCIRPAPLVSTDVTDETIFALKSVVKNPPNNLSKKDVVEFTVRFVDYDNIGHLEVLHSHALIALRIFEANVGQQKLTIIRVLDSNGPQIGEITCADDKPPVVYQGQKYKSCYYPPLGYIILTTPTHFNTYLAEQHDTWCRDHAASLNSFETEYCNRDFGEWLQDSDNYMAINNGTGQLSSQNGYCASWSMFTILVAYKGIFTGYDYHPNDGYIVGHGCNAQHYPDESGKKSAKLNPTNWLGSIYNSSSNWLGSISDALSKFWPFK